MDKFLIRTSFKRLDKNVKRWKSAEARLDSMAVMCCVKADETKGRDKAKEQGVSYFSRFRVDAWRFVRKRRNNEPEGRDAAGRLPFRSVFQRATYRAEARARKRIHKERESVLSSWPPFHQRATEQMVQATANRGKARMPVAVPFTTILARRF